MGYSRGGVLGIEEPQGQADGWICQEHNPCALGNLLTNLTKAFRDFQRLADDSWDLISFLDVNSCAHVVEYLRFYEPFRSRPFSNLYVRFHDTPKRNHTN